MQQLPIPTRYSDSPIWATVLAGHEAKRGVSGQPTEFPSRVVTRISPSQLITFLAHYPQGTGAIYPIHAETSPQIQRQRLKVAATNAGIKIDIHRYTALELLVERTDSFSSRVMIPKTISPRKVQDWKYQQRKREAPVPALPEGEFFDYRAYIDLLMDQTDEDPKAGVLVPITQKGAIEDQTRLHRESRLKRVKIKTQRWDDLHLLITFRGFWETA
jgi:hypothetical protein